MMFMHSDSPGEGGGGSGYLSRLYLAHSPADCVIPPADPGSYHKVSL